MPSSITLTVSHLPTSSSFFLSALQPLDHIYRGRSTNAIGFGPASSPNTPTDFWITQEIPGVPAGAAHVAFPAANRAAVQSFFMAALKAGGKIHGEPTVRDSSGYYSAAVIDFDGNSIEAVYRPTFSDDKENDVKSMMSSKSSMANSKAPSTVSRTTISHTAPLEARSVASVSKSAAPSQASASVPIPRHDSGDIFNNILGQARAAANMAKQVVSQAQSVADVPASSAQNSTNSGSGDAIMGTLLGVAAGAALHYAFSNWNNNTSDNNSNEPRPSIIGPSVIEPPSRSEYQHQHQQPYYRAIEAPPSDYGHTQASGGYGQRAITMEDHDYASAIQPTSTRSRVSKNSGSAIATPFDKPQSATSRTSRKTEAEGRMIEPPRSSPPTSYKAPSVITTAETVPVSVAGSSVSQTKSKHSRRSLSSSRSHTSRHSDKSEKTVVRITETFSAVKGTSSSPMPAQSESGSKASTIKAASKAPSTVIRDREPEEYPLPPSRASTWIGSFHDSKSHASKASEKSKHSEKSRHSSASKHSEGKSGSKSGRSESGRSGMSKSGSKSGRSESGRSGMSKSVIGKIREMETLDVTPEEVGPDDSVSQVSSRG